MITHDNIERSLPLMVVMIVIALSWGGMVEIVPLFFHEDTTEAVEGLEPYTALQLEGGTGRLHRGLSHPPGASTGNGHLGRRQRPA